MPGHPLFILAPPRSFTSVTCGMIGQHPEMYGLPEVNLFAADDYVGLQRMYHTFRPRLQHGLLRAIAELGLGGQTEHNVAAAKNWLRNNADATTAELFEDLMHWADPKRLVDKSPIYVLDVENMRRMERSFPECQYLHLTRHPRDNCKSVVTINAEIGERESEASEQGYENRRGSARFISQERLHPDKIWLNPHLRITEFLDEIPESRQMLIRGEDLLADPDTHLAQIAEWLGVSTSAEAVEAMKHPERSPFACYGPRNARIGNDPGFLESAELRPFKPKTSSLDGPLEWQPELELSEDLKEVAALFGYS